MVCGNSVLWIVWLQTVTEKEENLDWKGGIFLADIFLNQMSTKINGLLD